MPTKWLCAQPKTQISLGICPVWSEASLCAQRVAKDPWFLHADSEDSDQTERMPRFDLSLRWAHSHFVGFVMSRLILKLSHCKLTNVHENLIFANTFLLILTHFKHRNHPKCSDRPVGANSVHPDQTALQGAVWSGLHWLPFGWSFGCLTVSQHDKTNKMSVRPAKTPDQPGHPPSLISLRCRHENSLGP